MGKQQYRLPRIRMQGIQHELRAMTIAALVILLIFLVFGFLESEITKTLEKFSDHQWQFALFSALFLTADIVLPVPSSIVMYLNGHVLGWALGTWCSWSALMLSAGLGYALGGLFRKRGQAAPPDLSQKNFKNDLALLLLSRGIPVLSETVCILWGWKRKPLRLYLAGNALGYFPVALIYAWAGNTGRTQEQFLLVFACTLVLSGVLYLVGRRYLGR